MYNYSMYLTLVGVATCATGRTRVTPPADGMFGGEGGIAPPPSTMAPPGDNIGRRSPGYPGRGVEMGGERTGDWAGAAATTPGEMG